MVDYTTLRMLVDSLRAVGVNRLEITERDVWVRILTLMDEQFRIFRPDHPSMLSKGVSVIAIYGVELYFDWATYNERMQRELNPVIKIHPDGGVEVDGITYGHPKPKEGP